MKHGKDGEEKEMVVPKAENKNTAAETSQTETRELGKTVLGEKEESHLSEWDRRKGHVQSSPAETGESKDTEVDTKEKNLLVPNPFASGPEHNEYYKNASHLGSLNFTGGAIQEPKLPPCVIWGELIPPPHVQNPLEKCIFLVYVWTWLEFATKPLRRCI